MIFSKNNVSIPGWCRIHVLFADVAHKAVILRKDPKEWPQQIALNTDTDPFTYGQWIRGGLKPEQSDISPSGKYLNIIHLIVHIQRLLR